LSAILTGAMDDQAEPDIGFSEEDQRQLDANKV
jgi:hypothetical protein